MAHLTSTKIMAVAKEKDVLYALHQFLYERGMLSKELVIDEVVRLGQTYYTIDLDGEFKWSIRTPLGIGDGDEDSIDTFLKGKNIAVVLDSEEISEDYYEFYIFTPKRRAFNQPYLEDLYPADEFLGGITFEKESFLNDDGSFDYGGGLYRETAYERALEAGLTISDIETLIDELN